MFDLIIYSIHIFPKNFSNNNRLTLFPYKHDYPKRISSKEWILNHLGFPKKYSQKQIRYFILQWKYSIVLYKPTVSKVLDTIDKIDY